MNTGSPEYLVIAGGFEDSRCKAERNSTVLEIEVLVGKKWLMIQPLPKPYYYCLGPLVHNGILYLNLVDRSKASISYIYCKMETLVGVCAEVSSHRTPKNSGFEWKELTGHGEDTSCCLTAFKDKLIALAIPNLLVYWDGGYTGIIPLYAYLVSFSHEASSWVNVGESLDGISAATYLPSGELVVVGFRNRQGVLLKASTRGMETAECGNSLISRLYQKYEPGAKYVH